MSEHNRQVALIPEPPKEVALSKQDRARRFMGIWRAAWEDKYQRTWIPEQGVFYRVRTIAEDLPDESELLDSFHRYLEDHWYDESCHPLSGWLRNPNKYMEPTPRAQKRWREL